MSVIIAHLSDAHLKTPNDTLMQRADALAGVLAADCGPGAKALVIAFTGDATDKGHPAGFAVASRFLSALSAELQKRTGLKATVLLVPGNHDVVAPTDPALRDLAIEQVTKQAAMVRPVASVESVILSALGDYYEFAGTLGVAVSPTKASPYYLCHDTVLDGRRFRFHLLNSSWMCTRGQTSSCLLYPLNELRPPPPAAPIDYEVTLLHHPFQWFKQPEAMRPLREAIEKYSDMVLTGHEHVGRLSSDSVHGVGTFEYCEGEALQDGEKGRSSGFHVFEIDFDTNKQSRVTYRWEDLNGAFVRDVGPVVTGLGRNQQRTGQPYRLRRDFVEKLDDPELPVTHSRLGKVTLSTFYTYPDLRQHEESENAGIRRLPGDSILTMLKSTPRVLLLGDDRSGKSCLAKRLFADLHAGGDVPVLVSGAALNNVKPDRVRTVLEGRLKDQYEAMPPEVYWQLPKSKMVLILDDMHKLPALPPLREAVIEELHRRFDRVVLIGSTEFYYEEMIPIEEAERVGHMLWAYPHYVILPFGYQRREQFVKKWVALDDTQTPHELHDKASKINELLGQFLRNNPFPQSPWVVLIVVQAADSPEPLHAQSGSYGYLLQALITAALAKSHVTHPINGKYRWLGELASAMYKSDQSELSDGEARAVHETYRKEYGVSDLDYKEMRDDMIAAGVLRADAGGVTFRQPYTYCYFVAWHLAQRLHANDDTARADVRRLWDDLYHQDTANVLVFLAHLTNSQIVLDEMTGSANRLFAGEQETDLETDVGEINALCAHPEEMALPPGNPEENRVHLRDAEDDHSAAEASRVVPRRQVTLRPSKDAATEIAERSRKVIEIMTALRAIEILGQVLRNEATARKKDSLVKIADEAFRLGRRLLGFLFGVTRVNLERALATFEEQRRLRSPKAADADIKHEANLQLFRMLTYVGFAVVKSVALAVGDRNLKEVFKQLVAEDNVLANRIYNLGVNLEITYGEPPLREAERLSDELLAKVKKIGRNRSYNTYAHTLIRALVIDYLYLNHVPTPQIQRLCQKLHIVLPSTTSNPATKRIGPNQRDKKQRPPGGGKNR